MKRVKGTPDFLGLDDSAKDCQIEPFDNCTTSRYVKRLIQNCGCLPLTMKAKDFKVKFFIAKIHSVF